RGLKADGGDDCPEFSQTALLQAIDAARSSSRLFLFTDATAKDSSSHNLVISRAQAKGIRIIYVLTGSCSPIDEAYTRGAKETGGQLFFLDPSEISRLLPLVQPQLSGDLALLLATDGRLSGKTQQIDIPVDSTITQLTVSVSITTKHTTSLHRPSGA